MDTDKIIQELQRKLEELDSKIQGNAVSNEKLVIELDKLISQFKLASDVLQRTLSSANKRTTQKINKDLEKINKILNTLTQARLALEGKVSAEMEKQAKELKKQRKEQEELKKNESNRLKLARGLQENLTKQKKVHEGIGKMFPEYMRGFKMAEKGADAFYKAMDAHNKKRQAKRKAEEKARRKAEKWTYTKDGRKIKTYIKRKSDGKRVMNPRAAMIRNLSKHGKVTPKKASFDFMGMLKPVFGIFKKLLGPLVLGFTAISGIVLLLIGMAKKFKREIEDISNSLGASMSQATAIRKSMFGWLQDQRLNLATTQEISEAYKGIAEGIAVLPTMSEAFTADVASLGYLYGAGAENAGKLHTMLMKLMSPSQEIAVNTQAVMDAMATAKGIAPGIITQELLHNSELYYRFFAGAPTKAAETALQLQKMGLSISNMGSLADKVFDVESSYQFEAAMTALMGRVFSLGDVRDALFSGDLIQAGQSIMEQVVGDPNATAEQFGKALSSMNMLQRQMLSEGLGMSMEDMMNMVYSSKLSKDFQDKFSKVMGDGFSDAVKGQISSELGVTIDSPEMYSYLKELNQKLDIVGKDLTGDALKNAYSAATNQFVQMKRIGVAIEALKGGVQERIFDATEESTGLLFKIEKGIETVARWIEYIGNGFSKVWSWAFGSKPKKDSIPDELKAYDIFQQDLDERQLKKIKTAAEGSDYLKEQWKTNPEAVAEAALDNKVDLTVGPKKVVEQATEGIVKKITDEGGKVSDKTSPIHNSLSALDKLPLPASGLNTIGGYILEKSVEAVKSLSTDKNSGAMKQSSLFGVMPSPLMPVDSKKYPYTVTSPYPMPSEKSFEQSQMYGLLNKYESKGDYDALFGYWNKEGKQFEDTQVSKMTLGQLKDFSNPQGEYGQAVQDSIGRVATPMGAGQIVGSTLKKVQSALGLSDDTVYSPEVQMQMIQYLAKERLKQSDTMEGKRAGLRSEWEGFKNASDDELDKLIYELEGKPATGRTAPPDIGMNTPSSMFYDFNAIGSGQDVGYQSNSDNKVMQDLLQEQRNMNSLLSDFLSSEKIINIGDNEVGKIGYKIKTLS